MTAYTPTINMPAWLRDTLAGWLGSWRQAPAAAAVSPAAPHEPTHPAQADLWSYQTPPAASQSVIDEPPARVMPAPTSPKASEPPEAAVEYPEPLAAVGYRRHRS